jgi:hypothetical protein
VRAIREHAAADGDNGREPNRNGCIKLHELSKADPI